MSPRTEQQLEVIRNEKSIAIKKVALELFATHGYHSTSVSQIAKFAKISKGLIYNYYKSKEDILRTILQDGLNHVMQNFDPNKDGVLERNELEHLILHSFRAVQSDIEFWQFYYSIAFQPEGRRILQEITMPQAEHFQKMTLDYFTKAGFENPSDEAMLFHATIDGLLMNYVFTPDMWSIDTIVNTITKRFCK